jgi:hypothetical protein
MILAMRRSLTPQRPLLAAFTSEAETHLVSVYRDMAVLQGCEAVAVVLLCGVVISDADQRGLQKMDHGRQHLFARQSAQGHMLPDLLSDGGQCVGEGNDMLVLRAFAHLTEARVVAVLLAPFRVAPRRLNVAI